MTALGTETDQAGQPAEPGRHRLTHLVCCDQHRGLCGADVRALATVPDSTAVSCALCDAIDEAGSTCGAVLCLLRQWLRQHLGQAR